LYIKEIYLERRYGLRNPTKDQCKKMEARQVQTKAYNLVEFGKIFK